jgi:hypothetical protein
MKIVTVGTSGAKSVNFDRAFFEAVRVEKANFGRGGRARGGMAGSPSPQ